MAPIKRPHEVIDLTDDSPVKPRIRRPRTNTSSSQVYPGSSTARPSQSAQASQRTGSSPTSSSRIETNREGQGPASQQRDPFEDEPELVDLTQADDGPVFGLYGTINNKVVGVRYYSGIVSPGEVVILRREPTNQ